MILFRRKVSDPLKVIAKKGVGEVLSVESVFKNGDMIPVKYTCDDRDVSPPLRIGNAPENTVAYALIMYDPDAPIGTFYHWLLYDIPVDENELPENIPKHEETPYGMQGVNDFGNIGYGGPCPPPGHGRHRYYFLVLALNSETGLKPGVRVNDLIDSVKDKVIGYGVLMGVYSR